MSTPNENKRSWAQETVRNAVESGRLLASSGENLERWISEPQYNSYVSEIIELLEAESFDQLNDYFWEVINFGTGGRRGRMASIGSATINERTIAESAHGLATYYKKQHSNGNVLKAVVAHDPRIRSVEFAQITASTLAAHGFKVYFFDGCRSTPELSFAVRHLNCGVGVMISASHNPPSDNGFKAYWSNGAQVLAPHDQGIVDSVYEASNIPEMDFLEGIESGKIEVIAEKVDEAYLEEVVKLSLSENRNIKALFSPLHGVGETSVFEVLIKAGFKETAIFQEQREPDGNFSNVPQHLPNPERVEVFYPLMEMAASQGADLILASDPDADRIAICVHDQEGHFIPLTGNQSGALIVDYLLRKRKAAGTLSPEHFVVETLVTTPLIADQARAFGIKAVDDLLVGFKYIAQTMDEHGPDKFVFGAEESLGYLAGEYCRDKDAAVAAMYLMEAAAELKTESNKTLLNRLDELYLQYGYYLEGQISQVCEGSNGQQQIQKLMQTFREQPPAELGANRLTEVLDYGQHEVRTLPENQKTADLPKPSGNLLMFALQGDSVNFRIAVRPSGTEPKIKFYFFAHSEVSEASGLPEVKENTKAALEELQSALVDWLKSALTE